MDNVIFESGIEFNFSLFKECLINNKIKRKYSFDDFTKILDWIGNKFYETYDVINDVKFLATDTKDHLSKAFDLFYEQEQTHSVELSGGKMNLSILNWHENFVNALFEHAINELQNKIIENFYTDSCYVEYVKTLDKNI